MQATGGLATGVLVFGVAAGGIAALVVCYALGRIGRFGPRATAALIAGAALLTVYVVPFLKYPANPPAVGNPDTIGKRTTLFFLMVALSVLLAVAAVIIGKRLAPRLGNWNATTAAGAGYVVVIGLAYAFLPSFDEVGKDFPPPSCGSSGSRRSPSRRPCGPSSASSSATSPNGSWRRRPGPRPPVSRAPSTETSAPAPAAVRRPGHARWPAHTSCARAIGR